MPDQDFPGLLRDLSAAAEPPPWSEIRARRARRTRAVAGRSTLAAVVVVAAAGIGLANLGRPAVEGTPAATPRVSASSAHANPPPTPVAGVVADSVGFSASGRLYALLHTCTAGCDTLAGTVEATLWRSTDTGRDWARRSAVPGLSGAETLLVGSDENMWIADTVTGTAVVYATVNGGASWTKYLLGPADLPVQPVAYAGGVAWFAAGVTMWTARPGDRPVPLSVPRPAGDAARVQSAVALSGSRVVVEEFRPGAAPVWLRTDDGGGTWSGMPSPCPGRIAPGTVAHAPDGTVLAACPADSGDLLTIRVSDDGGGTWRDQAALHSVGRRVYPVTATSGWLTGPGGDILHTDDGRTWDVVRDSGLYNGPVAFGARDGLVAVFAFPPDGSFPQVYVTLDGGRRWTPYVIR